MTSVKESFEEELTAVLAALLGCEAEEIIDIFKSKDFYHIEMAAQSLSKTASSLGVYEVSLKNLKKEIGYQEEWDNVFLHDTDLAEAGCFGSEEETEEER